jgi:hypothetical protein
MTSALRSHLLHSAHRMPPARLSVIRWTAFAPAQMGHTNGTRTGIFTGATVVTDASERLTTL